jgi:hypothetical protein
LTPRDRRARVGVVEALGLGELLAEILELASILPTRLSVEHVSGIAETA